LRREQVEIAIANQARELRLVGLSQLGRRRFRLVARRGSPDPIKNVWHFRYVYSELVQRMIVNSQALVPRICDGAPWFDRSKLFVLPNGIDVEATQRAASANRARGLLQLASHELLVTMVGEVGWRKDQATFLRAIARVPIPNVVFAIVGEGDDRAELMRQAEAMGLVSPRLRWLGFREDSLDILAASDLVVLPSREEGFPNTLLEAMALARCVVATPVDGIPELVIDGECGRLCPVGDDAAFASSIEALLGDFDLRARLGRAAQDRVRRHFQQSRQMDRFEELMQELSAKG
jgi:glycosyltransferase involved in cell wall biosynthesis